MRFLVMFFTMQLVLGRMILLTNNVVIKDSFASPASLERSASAIDQNPGTLTARSTNTGGVVAHGFGKSK
jgi:hypothetical protein